MRLYSVRILPDAERAILEQAQFIAADKPIAASNWLEHLWDTIDDLARFPKSNAPAAIESSALGAEVRKLVFGSYLIFYRVDDERCLVEVMRFRHAARLPEQQ